MSDTYLRNDSMTTNEDRDPVQVQKEIRSVRHGAERLIYWFMFAINLAALIFVAVAGFGTRYLTDADFTTQQEIDTLHQLQGFGSGLVIAVLVFFGATIFYSFWKLYADTLCRSVKVTEKNFPEIYEKSVEFARLLGMKKVPEVFLTQQNGVINAFACWAMGKKYVRLNAELVDVAYIEHKNFDVVLFAMGHEFGHLYYNHATWRHALSILFANMIPLLNQAYSRTQEYSVDRVGQILSGVDGRECMAMFIAGRHMYPLLDCEDYLETTKEKRNLIERIGVTFVNLLADHPILPYRIAAVMDPQKKSGRLF